MNTIPVQCFSKRTKVSAVLLESSVGLLPLSLMYTQVFKVFKNAFVVVPAACVSVTYLLRSSESCLY